MNIRFVLNFLFILVHFPIIFYLNRIFSFQDHNCVKELRDLVQNQQQKLQTMYKDMAFYKSEINEIKDEVRVLKVKIYLHFQFFSKVFFNF